MARPDMTERSPEQVEDGEELVTLFNEDGTTKSEEATETPAAEAPAPVAEVPDKYAGKSQEELVAMLSEQERFSGKQANEVGELRKSVDALIQAQLNTQAAPTAEPEPEEEVNFFEDPDAAVDRRIANHPAIKEAEAEALKLKRQTATNSLATKHPDMNDIVADSAFIDWVQASPMRVRMLTAAHSHFDTDAADELFSSWKEKANITQQTLEMERGQRDKAVAAAGVSSTPASAEGAPVKKYRRSDIIRLMQTDPERYASMADEILAAYADKRVIN